MNTLGYLVELLRMRGGKMLRGEAEKMFVEGLSLAPGLTFDDVLDNAIRSGRVEYNSQSKRITLIEVNGC